MKNPFSKNITANDADTYMKHGQKMALDLFRHSAKTVPAYKDFLKKEGVDSSKIRTFDDFSKYVPPIDKKNYLSQYPLADLSADGNLFSNRIISVSSGSSGVPFYWPRGAEQDQEGAEMHTDIYDHVFQMDQKSTLLVICFSYGYMDRRLVHDSLVIRVRRPGAAHQYRDARP